jgi:predicted DNA-binding transcriptional regulator AlpA
VNTTSRAILQTLIATDSSLSGAERRFVQRLIDGQTEIEAAAPTRSERRLVTQKRAAELLSVNRVTIWRMTKDGLLHPVEILPGTWRYPLNEIVRLMERSAGEAASSPWERIPAGLTSAA